MTDSYFSQFKKRFHLIMVADFLFSIYGTGFIDCFLNPKYHGNTSFFNAISAFFSTKQSILLFPLLFLIIAGIAIYIYHKSWKDGLLDDKMGRKFRYSKKISPYGGAHVMEPYEYVDIAQIRKLKDCKGIIVGQLTEDGEECVDFNAKRINSHMYVTATSGSGKTFGFVKPYIFQSAKRRHSLVMTDPKGELYADTAGFLMDNGYHVRRLDFKNMEISDGWDCLKRLRGKNMRTKVQIFTNAVISNISPNDNSIFAKGSDSLLQALILRVLLGHDFPEQNKNIKSVYQMLQNPAGYEFLDQMFDKNSLTEEELPCLPPYLAYKQGSENLSANIATHLANGLQLFQDELLCDVLSTDDIDLVLPGQEPCAYYCVFPDDHDTYRFIISLFFTMFFIELVDYADDQPKRKLPIPVDFLLDEFPSIGIIPDWAKKMSTVRSRDISCVMITQDFTQLKQNYRETWPTILNNCGALVTLGINEMETAEWISKRIGEASIEVESSTESEVAGRRRKDLVTKQSVGVGKRSLFTPSEIFEIGQDNNLVVIAGRNPIYSRKTPYTIFPEADKLRDIQKDDIINIDDKEGKKLFRACENEYIRQFWATHDIKPKGDPGDLSDAMYTEPSQDPVTMVLAVLKEDALSVARFFKNLGKKKADKNDDPITVQPAAPAAEEKTLSNETAETGAFDQFFHQYKERCAAASLLNTSMSSMPDFELDDEPDDEPDDEQDEEQENEFAADPVKPVSSASSTTFSVDEETGEVTFFSDPDQEPKRQEAPKTERPDQKPPRPSEASPVKARFEPKGSSTPAQNDRANKEQQNPNYTKPPVKSSKH